MDTNKKLFAFKLADDKAKATPAASLWKAREGVSIAGCSLYGNIPDNYRTAKTGTGVPPVPYNDLGAYC